MSRGWSFHNPVRVTSSPGACLRLGDIVDYRRMVLVTSGGFRARGLVDRLGEALGSRLVGVVDDVSPNPDVRDIDRQAAAACKFHADAIVGLGGGSSMDTAKALARLLVQPEGSSLVAHFREGTVLAPIPALPVVAVPTTAGTGAEVTPFGTVWDFERAKKYSLAGEDLYPFAAILDPGLSLGLPREVTISSGLDAISHAFESTWNRNANPVTLGLATKSLQLSLPSLPRLMDDPGDIEARGAMMEASLLAGMAISHTRTALAHSISYPLTAHFGLPHGVACSFTLPALLRFNSDADDGRLLDLSRALGYTGIEGVEQALLALFREVDLHGLFLRYLPDVDAMRTLEGEMLTPGRADNNLRAAGRADVSHLIDIVGGQLSDRYA